MIETRIEHDVDLLWQEVWSRPDTTIPVSFGVDQSFDQDEVKHYRAFCRSSIPEYDMVHSPIYTACDAADVVVPDMLQGRLLMTTDRDRLVSEAAAARALMAKDQRSPEDMVTIAEKLHQTAVKNYRKWEAEEEARQAQALDDAQSLLSFRHWLRGAELLLKQGSTEEKKLLSRFMK